MLLKQAIKKFLLIFFSIGVSIHLQTALIGQEHSIKNYSFKYLTVENGLSNNIVNTIIQDYDNFIWVGTSEGLNRFDGHNFKKFFKKINDSTSLSDNYITSLCLDTDSSLWIGTHFGISRYNPTTEKIEQYILQPALSQINVANIITAIHLDKQKNLITSVEGGLLFKFDRKLKKFIPFGPNFYRIRNFIIDSQNNFWLAHHDGFSIYNPQTNNVRKFDKFGNLPIQNVKALFIYNDTLWIGTENGNVFLYSIKHDQLVKFNIPFENVYIINHITKWHKDHIIISTSNGLIVYHKPKFQLEILQHEIYNPQGLNNFGVNYVFEDIQGNLWLGVFQGGINVAFTGKEFYNLNRFTAPALDIDNINAILQDHNNQLWLGSFDVGMNVIDLISGNRKLYMPDKNNPFSIPYGTIFTIYEDSKKRIWIGNYLEPLLQFDYKTNSFIRHKIPTGNPEKPYCSDVRSITEDKNGNIWFIAHGNGLWKYNPENNQTKSFKFNKYNTYNSLADDWAFQIIKDKDQIFWIATPSGLSKFDPTTEKFTNYYYQPNDTNSLSSNMIQVLFEDSHGILWIGTNFGLTAFNKYTGNFYRFYQHNGLPSNDIRSILEHRAGELWISTSNGISKVNYSIKKGAIACNFRNYNIHDNLQDNIYWTRSACKLNDGRLVFGGEKGIVLFDPNRITENKIPPKVFLTDFKIFGKSIIDIENNEYFKGSISKTRQIILPYHQNYFSINYVALNYIANTKNNYAYKLEGYDKNWNYVGNKLEATYTKVKSGKYVFRVKACNNDGYWNEKGASVEIIILPPFWETWWFRAIVILLIIFAFLLFDLYRLRLLRKQNQLLEEKVAERTTQLISANEELKELNNYISEQNQEILAQNQEILNKNEEINAQKNMLEEQKVQLENALNELSKYRNKLEELVEERTRELLIAKEKAEESDRLKSSFLANLSHEIRTPLNSIIGFTHMIFEPSISDEEKRKFKTIVDSSSNTLLNIINDIIDFSKIEAGHIDVIIKEIKLSSLFDHLKDTYINELKKEQLVSHKNIELHLNLPEQLKEKVIYTDEIRLMQILNNLISNAIKFTHQGHIEIGCELNEEKEIIKFYVKDTGIGIKPEHIEVIFDRFRKIEEQEDGYLYRGTGLGLAITKKLVTLLGGEIWVESKYNEGSIFSFTIPYKNGSTKPEPQQAEIKNLIPDLFNFSILVAEDDYANFEYISRVLQATNAKIFHAINGKQVLHIMFDHPEIKLILMDIRMPEMDGIMALKELRNRGIQVPVVALTAYALSDEIRLLINEGFNGYLIKPVAASEVYATLVKFLK